jgi:predicted RNase H-like HicB family nuclease
MSTKTYTVTCHWDDDARMWYVADTDVPGLATEAATLDEMESKLTHMIAELLAVNAPLEPHQDVRFELIAHKRELALSA